MTCSIHLNRSREKHYKSEKHKFFVAEKSLNLFAMQVVLVKKHIFKSHSLGIRKSGTFSLLWSQTLKLPSIANRPNIITHAICRIQHLPGVWYGGYHSITPRQFARLMGPPGGLILTRRSCCCQCKLDHLSTARFTRLLAPVDGNWRELGVSCIKIVEVFPA